MATKTNNLKPKLLKSADLWREVSSESNQDVWVTSVTKHIKPDGTYLQQKQLEFVQIQRNRQISCVKVNKLGSISHGVIDPFNHYVVVVKSVGNVVPSHGTVGKDGIQRLPFDEALFLLDLNQLQIYHPNSQLPVSIQEAWQQFFTPSSPLSLEQYLTFSHFTRLGFILLHHRNRKPVLDATTESRSLISKQAKRTASLPLSENSKILKLESVATFDNNAKPVSLSTNIERLCESVHQAFDFSQVNFAGASEDDNVSRTNLRFETFSIMHDRHRMASCTCANWTQVKSRTCQSCQTPIAPSRNPGLTGVITHESALNVPQKLALSEQLSYEDLKSKISAPQARVDNAALTAHPGEEKNQSDSPDFTVYDVYKPKKNFRRSKPGQPQYTVLSVSSDDSFPDLQDIVEKHDKLHISDETSLLYSISDHGDLSFYSFKFDYIPIDYRTAKNKTSAYHKLKVSPSPNTS